ncbi:glycoside hydrolase family 2 protein [Melanomma pulvis-pyrius CBS 109.77]|uniref:Glycoside hydrolase family 2 protein n=1 Tax=Melanomma pulvis-pyrius CBS 109.77 TaxID=1314802 RepID=A0A6A6XL32_9PLEO|nr:glycoside hydrolase family 2 protein [Melanomma pulvis-pyrius CBS 109.77]
MDEDYEATYPRPDFQRTALHWNHLNSEWDFLFDDEDVGLLSGWHQNGLPSEVIVHNTSGGENVPGSESESITAKIAANTQNLIQDNLVQRTRKATTHKKQKIKVPYVFQAPASGINERDVHEVLWYETIIGDLRNNEELKKGYRYMLRFGAVDYEAKVWVNGQHVGGHRGGHVPFDVDITDAVDAKQSLNHRVTIRVYDSAYDLTQPRGKQYWGAKPESIFYTPSGGIWQNVWAEVVPSTRLANSGYGTVLRSNDIEIGDLHATIAILGRRAGHKYSIEIEGHYAGVLVKTSEKKHFPKATDNVSVDLNLRLSPEQLSKVSVSALLSPLDNDRGWKNGLALWSPDYPQLYDLSLRLYDATDALIDEVKTTTGMRSLDWTSGNGAFKLNGYPLFQALCLDQGYWPNTFMTPPNPSALKADIEMAKKMGFNGCRKHQKVEDPIFLYWADHLGYLVWGEMANAYSFSSEYVDRFNQEWVEAMKRDINHPCVVAWTPANESWGYTDLKSSVEQRNHIRALYYMTKTLDPTRPVNDNCGWEHVQTDLTTFHDYADSLELSSTCATLDGILGPKAGRPMFVEPIAGHDTGSSHVPGAVVICTEFGGVNIAPASDSGTKDEEEGWGYTTAADSADLLSRVEKLVGAVVDGGHCSGFVWTQLTDIEQETNGLYSFDRKEKLDAKKVKNIINAASASLPPEEQQISALPQLRRNLLHPIQPTHYVSTRLKNSEILLIEAPNNTHKTQPNNLPPK